MFLYFMSIITLIRLAKGRSTRPHLFYYICIQDTIIPPLKLIIQYIRGIYKRSVIKYVYYLLKTTCGHRCWVRFPPKTLILF
jgi:hypothetical protein